MMTQNLDYSMDILERLVKTPSPSGYCEKAIQLIEEEVNRFGLAFQRTQKGNGLFTIAGKKKDTLLLSAHVDTLGAMVRSIKADGKLRMTSVGGFMMQSVEGEYCTVHLRDGREVRGTILNTMPSVHVYEEARSQERKEVAMEVRLDLELTSKKEVEEYGISVGDYISFDSRYEVTETGFIKSRHLDDKAGVAAIMGMVEYLHREGIVPEKTIQIMFSTYEEVGHGSSYIPEGITEVLAVDMGAIGDDLSCTEHDVSICVKDSSGPYDYAMVSRLVEIAKAQQLRYALDVYPFYGSDASAALRGGHDIKAALIGPGIHASHTLERTHKTALLQTINLLVAYVTTPDTVQS